LDERLLMPPSRYPAKELRIEERDGRLVSAATAWWYDRSPKGYSYVCIHGASLKDECDKCERGSKRFRDVTR
jgi:hypothetical protein